MKLNFTELVKGRHQKSEELMKHSASMSRAAAIETTMAHWWNGTPEGQIFSLVVASEGGFIQVSFIIYGLEIYSYITKPLHDA